MNKALKITAIVAAVLLGLGIVLALLGLAMGGFRPIVYGNGAWSVQQPVLSGEIMEETIDEEFYNLNVQVDTQKVRFVASDSLRVVYSYDDGLDIMSHHLEGNTLYLNGQTRNIYSSGVQFNLFNMGYRNNYNKNSEVTVYYPADAEFGEVIIKSDAADVSLAGFTAERIDLGVDFGNVKIENIQVEELFIDADAGNVTMKNVVAENSEIDMEFGQLKTDNFTNSERLTVENSAGNIILKGEFAGSTYVNCDFGKVTFETSLPKESYQYDVQVEFGKLTFDGENRGGVDTHFSGGNGTNYLGIEASAGDVSVSFNR